MIPTKAVKVEPICEAGKLGKLASPFNVKSDKIFFVSHSGEILKLENNNLKVDSHMGGQPNAIVVSPDEKSYFIADFAHQAIFSKSLDDESNDFNKIVYEFEGIPLLGPNSLVLSSSNQLFFTDSGAFGETMLENAKGSVFLVDFNASNVKSLALNCLSYPSGLALAKSDFSTEENILYVCETGRNCLLRFVKTNEGVYYYSVFHQFSGRFGPTAVSLSSHGFIFVARYDFAIVSNIGVISVLSPKGEALIDLILPENPEINGMTFDVNNPGILYVTENSTHPVCLRVLVNQEELEKIVKKEHKKDMNA